MRKLIITNALKIISKDHYEKGASLEFQEVDMSGLWHVHILSSFEDFINLSGLPNDRRLYTINEEEGTIEFCQHEDEDGNEVLPHHVEYYMWQKGQFDLYLANYTFYCEIIAEKSLHEKVEDLQNFLK